MSPLQLTITKDADPVLLGSSAMFELEVRDRHGSLTTPDQPASVLIYSVDPDSNALTKVLEGATEGDTLEDGTVLPGRLLFVCDASKIGPVGAYLIRFTVPYKDSQVIAQELFTISDPDVLAA